MSIFRSVCSWLKRLNDAPDKPTFFVRVCRRKSEFLSIVNEVTEQSDADDEELAGRVRTFVLEAGDDDNSMFGVGTNDPLDPGHSLAVIADGIAQRDFVSKRKTGCSRCSVLLPADQVFQMFSYRHTPHNNTNFAPADDLHFDLRPKNSVELCPSGERA